MTGSQLIKLLIRESSMVSHLCLPGTWVNKLYCRVLKEIIQVLFARAWHSWGFGCTQLTVIVETYFWFADYFVVWFSFPQGESHLDEISVNSHVVIHVNSFTEHAFRRASHGEKCEMCRCFSISVISISWPVQMLLTASKMLNHVVIWIVPVLSVFLFPSILKSWFSNSVFCLSSSPLPQSNWIMSSEVRHFVVESQRQKMVMRGNHSTTYSHLPLS